ncbi:MAG: DNA repair protein RecN [Calditrichaeota bacterium]|nr:DNA repair protein RecN [Calditrichota bacterium]
MLKSIFIQNFALAYQLHLDFRAGLNILTGETGTGKSILIGAISAVLGGRVLTEVVRAGSEKALVEAIFEIGELAELKKFLSEKGLETEEELILRREIPLKGNSRAFINDIPVTIGTLSEIGDMLVDIHSQHEHQSLLRKDTHRYFIDALGKLERELATVSAQYEDVRKAENKLNELMNRSRAMDQKYELFQFQLNEIEKAAVKPGEDEELEHERRILANAEKIHSLASQFNQLSEGSETSLTALFSQASQILKELSEFSDEIKTISNEFSSARIIVDEATRNVEEFQNRIEYNPERLEEIEQRLATLSMLKKKYGGSIEEILKHRDFLVSELRLQENIEEEVKKAENLLNSVKREYTTAALALSESRHKVATECEKQVEFLLREIGMKKIHFRVNFSHLEEEGGIARVNGKSLHGDEYGIDQIEFYISPNPGEEFKPLARIASGGEISRIMLALKNILAESDRIPLLIFDEIDAGVSGHIALAVGKNIQSLARSHQVICITHLPQIASFGSSHFRVEKYVDNGRTFTRVTDLNPEERIKEIASLMAGKKITGEILQSARQLLSEAREQSDSYIET